MFAVARPSNAPGLLTQSLSHTPLAVIDNFHNSFPTAIERVEQIARDQLPADATQAQKDACKVDVVKADLRNRDAFADVFKKYTGSDAIYAVILVAALKAVGESGEIPIECVATWRSKSCEPS